MKLSEYKAEDYISGAADVKALLEYAAELEAQNERLREINRLYRLANILERESQG